MINNTSVVLIESKERQNEKQLEDSKKKGRGLNTKSIKNKYKIQ